MGEIYAEKYLGKTSHNDLPKKIKTEKKYTNSSS